MEQFIFLFYPSSLHQEPLWPENEYLLLTKKNYENVTPSLHDNMNQLPQLRLTRHFSGATLWSNRARRWYSTDLTSHYKSNPSRYLPSCRTNCLCASSAVPFAGVIYTPMQVDVPFQRQPSLDTKSLAELLNSVHRANTKTFVAKLCKRVIASHGVWASPVNNAFIAN